MQVDHTLLQASEKGDEKALYRLYEMCYGVLHGIGSRYAVDEDECCTMINSAFLKIVKGLRNYKTEVPFEAWIRRIMINHCIDHHRKHRNYKKTISYREELPNAKATQVDYNLADKLFNAEQLKEMIKELPPMSATVFNLFAIDGYSHKEICQMLDIKVGTSKWHLSNARSKLQLQLKSMQKTAGRLRNHEPGEERKQRV